MIGKLVVGILAIGTFAACAPPPYHKPPCNSGEVQRVVGRHVAPFSFTKTYVYDYGCFAKDQDPGNAIAP